MKQTIRKENGFRYYYHNHYQEFQHFGDTTVYDYIMSHTDPSLVYVEMDLYWGDGPSGIHRKI